MKNGLIENYILRGFVLTTSMGGRTVICRNRTLWILQTGILLQRIASSKKKAIVCHTRYVMIALMPWTQINRALFSDGGDTAGRSGHDRDDGGSPAGLLGYLPRFLYWPWRLHGMTQCQAKIKGPSINSSTRVIVDDGGLWDIRISVTLPATNAGMEIYPTVNGLRASVGGSAATSDWLCVLGPAESGSAL